MRVHSESEKWTKTSNLEPNRTEPRSQWNVSKEGDGSAQYFIFLKCQFMYLKDTLSKHTHTQTHTHTLTHRHRHRKRHGKLFCSVGKWKKWIFDRFMTIEPESSPFLNYCHRNRRTKFRISFAFQLLLLPLRPPASTLSTLVWFRFGFILRIQFEQLPFWLARKRKPGCGKFLFSAELLRTLATRRVCCNFPLPFFLSFLSFCSLETHVAEHTLFRKMLLSQKTLLCFVRSLGLS